jgi:hypothetical protein
LIFLDPTCEGRHCTGGWFGEVFVLERMLRDQLLPATGQTITTIPGIGYILATVIVGEIDCINRFRSPAAFAVYNRTAPARNSTGGRNRHKARYDLFRIGEFREVCAGRELALTEEPLATCFLCCLIEGALCGPRHTPSSLLERRRLSSSASHPAAGPVPDRAAASDGTVPSGRLAKVLLSIAES